MERLWLEVQQVRELLQLVHLDILELFLGSVSDVTADQLLVLLSISRLLTN